MNIYGGYRRIKTGVPVSLDHPVVCRCHGHIHSFRFWCSVYISWILGL